MTERTTAPTKLLRRRAMRPDAWGESYLADLIRLNGLQKPWGYHVDQVRSNLPGYTSAARAAHRIDKLTHQHAPDGRPQYGPLGLPRWASLHRSVAKGCCMVCMMGVCHGHSRWNIPLLPICTLYCCYLKDGLVSDDQMDLFEVSG